MINFSKPTTGREEAEAASAVLMSGWLTIGPKTREFEAMFAEYVGATYAVFVDSGTTALLMTMKAFDNKDRSFRIPALTFVATAEAPLNAGCKIHFADVDLDTLCLSQVDKFSIPVHYGGTKAKDGATIYDSAHRVERNDLKRSEATYCYSFHASKNMTTGKGGMVATNDKGIYDYVVKAREHGISADTEKRYAGTAYKPYTIDFLGWNGKSGDMNAAIGIEQLKKLPHNNATRHYVVRRYNHAFGKKWDGTHLYPLFVKNNIEFVEYMHKEGIQCSIHYTPLHRFPVFDAIPRFDSMPNTVQIENQIVNIPLHPQLTDGEIDYIITKVKESGMLI